MDMTLREDAARVLQDYQDLVTEDLFVALDGPAGDGGFVRQQSGYLFTHVLSGVSVMVGREGFGIHWAWVGSGLRSISLPLGTEPGVVVDLARGLAVGCCAIDRH